MDSRNAEFQDVITTLTFPTSWHSFYKPNTNKYYDTEYLYTGTIDLFKDYCNFSGSYINYNYRNTHQDTVKSLLLDVLNPDMKTDNSIANLLIKLRMRIQQAGKPLNPNGDLVKRIAFVQKHIIGDAVIDLANLCELMSVVEINFRKNEMIKMRNEYDMNNDNDDTSSRNNGTPLTQESEDELEALYKINDDELSLEEKNEIQEISVQPLNEVNDPLGWEKFFNNSTPLNAAKNLLKDYCNYDSYFYNMSSFFKGRNHGAVVREVIKNSNSDNVYGFLRDLEAGLMQANQPLKANSDLLNRIDFIQNHLDDRAINTGNLREYLCIEAINIRAEEQRSSEISPHFKQGMEKI